MHLKKSTSYYKGEKYEYAQIVRSVRGKNGKPTHEVVESLGRMESEKDWEWAESVLEAMEKEEKVPEAKDLKIEQQFELGGIWVAEELWRDCGIREALMESIEDRKPEFKFERIALLLAVNRLYEPSSDLSAHRWINERVYPLEEVEYQWISRSLDLLAEEKDRIEKNLFENLRESLDISPDLVFYDLTSSYFEGEGPDLADYGYSRDNRPDKEQVVLGVVMADGIPIAHEVWAGNTVDKSTLKETVERLRKRFEIGKVVFVADRGVISTPNLEELENIGYEYILSTKRRKDDLAEELLKEEIPGSERVRAKEVHREEVGDATRRYILCLDEETRESRLETLDEIRREKEKELADLKDRYERSQSGEGPGRPMTKKGVMDRAKRILGRNKRLLKLVEDEPIDWELNREVWEYERIIAGKFLLVTTSDLGPSATMESYKNLKDIERAFDELKNFLKLRPFYHQTEKRLRGHVFVCILALLLKRLTEKKTDKPFQKTMQKLEKLKANAVKLRGKRFIQRNEINQPQEEVLKSLEVLKPPKILDVGAKE